MNDVDGRARAGHVARQLVGLFIAVLDAPTSDSPLPDEIAELGRLHGVDDDTWRLIEPALSAYASDIAWGAVRALAALAGAAVLDDGPDARELAARAALMLAADG